MDFDEAIRTYGRALSRVAWTYTKRESDRQDLLQDILLAVWQALDRFESRSSLRTYLFRIAHNRGVRFVARRRMQIHADSDAAAYDLSANPETRAIDRQMGMRLQQAIPRLKLGQRQVLTMALEGLSQKEIGEVLGISDGAVAVRLHRARAALREMMEKCL